MKKISRLLLPLLLCQSLSLAAFADGPAAAGHLKITAHSNSSLAGTIDNIPFIVLRGTLQQRGTDLGQLWGDYFIRSLADIIPVVKNRDPLAWEKLAQAADTLFTTPSESAQQMQAFLAGLRQSVPLEKRSAPLGRDLELKDVKAIFALADFISSGQISPGNCSSFSAWGALTESGNVITARNLDYPTFPKPLPFAIVAQAPAENDRLATIEISPLWFGALTTMNEKGVVVLGHDESGLGHDYQSGFVPRFLTLRPAIETAQPASAPNDLAAALRDQHPLMGANFHVAMPLQSNDTTPTVLEWDGNPKDHGVTLRTPEANFPAIFCTNHYLARANSRLENSSSAKRFDTMSQMAHDALAQNKKIDVPTAEKILAAVAMKGPGVSTQMSVIALPAQRQLHIALSPKPGTPSTDTPYTQVDWSDLFNAK